MHLPDPGGVYGQLTGGLSLALCRTLGGLGVTPFAKSSPCAVSTVRRPQKGLLPPESWRGLSLAGTYLGGSRPGKEWLVNACSRP